MSSSDPEKLMLKADKLTKLSLTRWSADWRNATELYEKAGGSLICFNIVITYSDKYFELEFITLIGSSLVNVSVSVEAVAFRYKKDNAKAKEAFEKASKGQEILSSPWDAAKHMESAAALAKELGNWSEVADLYRKASELYIECGRSQPASDALAKGANALEDANPDEAIRMYTDACAILEEDGKEQMAFDLYRAATSVYVKLQRYTDAATFLLRWGLSADQCKAVNSQCKAYLSAIIVYLYAHDFKQAEKCFNDCSQIDAFLSSDQSRCASKLLSAYAEADIEEIKRVAQSSTISNLDHVIIRLARKLPKGDLTALKDETAKDEEALDENDLT